MFPCFPVRDPFNMTMTYAKSHSHGEQRHPVGARFTDGAHFCLGELRHAVSGTGTPRAVPDRVGVIFFPRCPTEVVWSVVAAIAVPVGYFVCFRRARSVKRHTNNNMNTFNRISSNSDVDIFTSLTTTQDGSLVQPLSTIGGDDPPINRSHPPKARRLIPWMTGHLAPLFDFIYGFISHVALRKRGGQERVMGANPSPVPNRNILALAPQGITILCLRV